LYKQKLLYKDKRLVNWDPKLHTAISDLEVEQKEVKGQLWHFKYPIEGTTDQFIVVATTRPETMLGDTAVAVHPDDERYRALVGRNAILPLVGRKLPIVADEMADPTAGSGAVKITPAHDFADFEVGKRHKLAMVNIFDRDARVVLRGNSAFLSGLPAKEEIYVVETYHGLDRFAARKRLVADMGERGLIEKAEPHTHVVPHGDRSSVPIEPWLTNQWYVDAATLAKPAIQAVEQGRTKFVPEHWTKTYYDWMRNIQPWCVSRQLWWGHQIPAWYGRKQVEPNGWASIDDDPDIFVAETEAEAIQLARARFGCEVRVLAPPPDGDLAPVFQQIIGAELAGKPRWEPIWRDPDVLDTWFSSGLWPFSTLGWPDKTPELQRYYPGDVLVTGFDIIFFWVARMMMLGIHFMDGEVPFREVYIHALVRDERGQKMSKSKGNIIDPLEVIDQYGCDALRFTFAALATPGRDIKLATSRVEGYRNFATKLWNAARFAEMNKCAPVDGFDPAGNRQTVNRWIVSEAAAVTRRVAQAIETYRFDDAAAALYQFAWGTFCDWYLEFAKPILGGTDAAAAAETRATVAWAIRRILRVLHPVMPFVTEELGQHFPLPGDKPMIRENWPEDAASLTDDRAAAEMNWVVKLIEAIRSIRAQYNVPGKSLTAALAHASPATAKRLDTHRELIQSLGRLEKIEVAAADAGAKGAIESVVDEAALRLFIADAVDKPTELKRIGKELDKIVAEAGKLRAKLGNEGFLAKAPPEVVEEMRERLAEAETTIARLTEARDRLAAM
ncbi:MAG: valine--tRNA ligase, partial [Alphaproteobacteria bacterium]|nr:valine--tRNA ligase [Alphaproteobacteria bacterium]